MSARQYAGRWHWVALFALACIVEWAAQQMKAWAGKKITAPVEKRPAAGDGANHQ